jgi:hypothetical protein
MRAALSGTGWSTNVVEVRVYVFDVAGDALSTQCGDGVGCHRHPRRALVG